MLVLALAGVEPEAIAADYGLSDARLGRCTCEGGSRRGPRIAAFLRERGTTAEGLIVEILAGFDVEAAMLAAGLEGGRRSPACG